MESAKGKGTTFTVKLPLELSAPIEKSVPEKASAEKVLTRLQVLVAEDNDLNAEIAAVLLEDKGIRVTRAADGCEAVELFRTDLAGTYDAILMDVMMPIMDGYTAAQKIRELQRPDARTVQIVAMTANTFAEDVAKCKAFGMNEHLPKSFKAGQLVASIAGCGK